MKAQQGELDAVLMYNALADKVKLQKDKNAFRQRAQERVRHFDATKTISKKEASISAVSAKSWPESCCTLKHD